MAKINILTEDLINKIAAGEVIERPASVVKELIENSLDAGATKIKIKIKDSGKKLIQIIDNGQGMNEEDAKISVLRHTTSKIKNLEDLFAIHTLGFRGEALASIAAVSRFSMITKQKEQVEGFNLVLEGGKVISSGILAADEGTTIEVHDLFFNTPARKKFLKSDSVELRHIVDVVLKYALINPEVSLQLFHENHQLLNSPSVKDLRDNIASIYGINLAKELLEINYEDESIIVKGFISKPHQARNDKNQQIIFVNERAVRNEEISKAVYEGYHSLLFVGKHPIFILNLKINPQKIDVNVHPHKQEIKIEQKEEITKSIQKAINEVLQKNNLIPIMEFNEEKQLTFGIPKVNNIKQKIETGAKYHFEPAEQKVLKVAEEMSNYNLEINQENKIKERNLINHEEQEIAEINKYDEDNEKNTTFVPEQHYSYLPESINLPSMKILGQIHKTFFVAETPGGMLLIDQHVVQERVLYEKFMQEYLNKNVATQTLLQGEIIEFSPTEKISYLENKETLQRLGFILEEFGESTYILKSIPSLLGRTQPKEIFFSVLDDLINNPTQRNRLEQVQEEIITRMACRASVKAGDTMTIPEIQKLLEELTKCKLPYTCPHGRAILIKIPVDELEKKFKRK